MTAHFPYQITSIVPKIAGLQEALPKSIGLLPFDGGVAGEKCCAENITFHVMICI